MDLPLICIAILAGCSVVVVLCATALVVTMTVALVKDWWR